MDGHFGAGADIDGIRAVIVLEREQDGFGAVLDMDEIAGGATGAANYDFFCSGLDRFDKLADREESQNWSGDRNCRRGRKN